LKTFLATTLLISLIFFCFFQHEKVMLAEIKRVKVELTLIQSQINGINKNLNNLGIYFEVKEKKEKGE
jgi:hypothetical protein